MHTWPRKTRKAACLIRINSIILAKQNIMLYSKQARKTGEVFKKSEDVTTRDSPNQTQGKRAGVDMYWEKEVEVAFMCLNLSCCTYWGKFVKYKWGLLIGPGPSACTHQVVVSLWQCKYTYKCKFLDIQCQHSIYISLSRAFGHPKLFLPGYQLYLQSGLGSAELGLETNMVMLTSMTSTSPGVTGFFHFTPLTPAKKKVPRPSEIGCWRAIIPQSWAIASTWEEVEWKGK